MLRPRAISVALLVVILLTATSTGAVAGALITGKKIKNNTITWADIKDGSITARQLSGPAAKALRGAKGARGDAGRSGIKALTNVDDQKQVNAGVAGQVSLSCPTGTVVAGATAYWLDKNVGTSISSDQTSATAYGYNSSAAAQGLVLNLTCFEFSLQPGQAAPR